MNKVTDLSTYKKSLNVGAGFFKHLTWYFVNVFIFNQRYLPVSAVKVALLRLFGARVGKGVIIKPKVNIKFPWKLHIGDNSWIGEEVWIDNLDEVFLGKNVVLSQGAMLLCGNHNFTKTSFDLITKPIILHDGVWIGARAVVTAGVVVESHAVLSVGSVASKKLDTYGIYVGNPAVFKKNREIND